MQVAISGRDRRVLVLGAVIICSLVAGVRGVPAWLTWQRGARRAALEARVELARALAALHDIPATHDSLVARMNRLVALAPAILDGDTPAGAGATLASLVSSAAEAADVRLGSVQVRTDSAGRETFTRVAVRASVTGDIKGITQMLLSLESGPTRLAVRELSITQPSPSAPATQPEALRVDLLVEGLAHNTQSNPSTTGLNLP